MLEDHGFRDTELFPVYIMPSRDERRALEIPWLTELTAAAQRAVRGSIDLRSFPAGTVLHHQGDGTLGQSVAIWGILSGSLRIELMTDTDGGCAIGMLQPGAWLGVAPNFTGQPRLTSISTCEPARLAAIPQRRFADLTTDHPELWRALGAILSKNVERMLERVGALMIADGKERLYRVLVCISGLPQSPRWREPVELRVSQEELGAAANLTSRSVRRMLRKLEEDGRVRVQYRRITLLPPP